MADFQTTVELRANTGALNRKLDKVNKKLRGVNTQVLKTQGTFKKFGQKTSGVFTKLNNQIKAHKAQIAGIGLALGAVILKGVADFKKFEDGMAQIATLGVKDLKKVEKQLDKVRKQFGITGAESTKAYYDIISAGATAGAQAMGQLTAATKLAKAGNTDLAGAVDVVTSGINIFGASGETATSITDKLFLAVKFGKTTVEELGKTFGFVAPVVAAAGLGMSDYAAAMASVTAGGIKTAQATTGFKAVLANMIKVTPKAAKKAKELGLEFGVSALKAKGFVGVMKDIAEKTGGDITQLGQLFDSIEAINTVAVLTSGKGLKNLERNFKAMGDSAGTTAEALEKVKKTASFNFAKFNQSLSIMSKNIGGSVVPVLIQWAEAMAPVVDFMAALIVAHPGIIKVTVAVTALGIAFAFLGGPFTAILAGAVYGIKKLLEHFGLFSEGGVVALEKMELAWGNFWAGLKLDGVVSTFDDMVSGFLGDSYFDLADYFTLNGGELIAKIKGFIKPITDYISGISWDGLWAGVENSIDWVIAQFEWLYEVLVGSSIIPDLVTDIMSWWDKLEFKGIKGLLDNVVGWFKDMYSDITGGTRQLATAFVNPFKAIGDLAKTTGNIVGGAFDKALAKSPMVNKALGGLRNAFVAVKTDAQAMGVHTAGLAIEQIKQVAATIKQKRELQKLIQVYRELNVAYVDDLDNLKASSVQKNLAMENSSKWQKKIIQSNIDRYKTLGREIGKVNKMDTKLNVEKLTRQLGKSVTKGRGFVSRFMFGDGTLLTWESKIQGLMGRIGGLFDKLGQKILTSVTKLQLLKTTAGEAKLAATQAAAAQTQATARSGLSGAKSAVKVTQEVSGVKDPTKSVSKKSIAILKKLQATANQWNKALNLADTELRAANEAMAKSGKNILKIRSGSTTLQKAMLLLGKGLGEAGSIFRLATEQLGKVIPKIKTGFGWLGSMGFKLINIGGILDGLKGSKGSEVY